MAAAVRGLEGYLRLLAGGGARRRSSRAIPGCCTLVATLLCLLLPAVARAQQPDLARQLLTAASENRHADALDLLDEGAPATARGEGGWSVIHLAARDGALPLLERLIALGADPADVKDDGWTPLMLAAFNGHAMAVALLLAHLPDAQQTVPAARDLLSEAAAKFDADPPGDSTQRFWRGRLLSETGRILDDPAYARNVLLSRAAATGDEERLNALLNEDAGADARDPWGYPAMVLAIANGHESAVSLLLRAGADPNAASHVDAWTALHFAARDNRLHVAAELLAAGAMPSPLTAQGATPLWLAAHNGHFNVVMALLAAHGWSMAAVADATAGLEARLARTGEEAAPAEVRARLDQLARLLEDVDAGGDANSEEVAAALLGRAIEANLSDVIDAMLAAGIDPGVGRRDGRSPLHAAALHGDSLTRVLLRAGATADGAATDGSTPLMVAAEADHAGAVLQLYLHGADLHRRDAAGRTAVDRAAAAGHEAVVRLLDVLAATAPASGAGDDPTLARDEAAADPPMEALERAVAQGHMELTATLLRLGLSAGERVRGVADISTGSTLLMLAADSGRAEIAGLLADAGADLYARDNEGLTALRRAAIAGHWPVARALVERIMDLDATDDDDASDLYWSLQQGHDSLAMVLLSAGADPTRRIRGWLPIHTAARDNRIAVLDALIHGGSPLDSADAQGYTPLMLAAYNGNIYSTAALVLALGPGSASARSASARALAMAEDRLRELADSVAALPERDRSALQPLEDDVRASMEVLRDHRIAGAAALVAAAAAGNAARIRALLGDATLRLHAGSSPWSMPPLIAAASTSQDAALALLEAGADIDAVERGWTALHYAVRNGMHDLTDALLQRGAAPHTPHSGDDRSPLMLASFNGNLYGAASVLRRIDPAHHRAAVAAAIEFARPRQQLLADSAAGLPEGPARAAVQNAAADIALALRMLDDPATAGGAALGAAAWFGRTNSVQALLADGVPPDAPTLLGRSALRVGVEHGHETVVQALLQAGADVHAVGENGWAALHYAARDGHGALVDSLLARGAEPDRATPEGFTPLYLAVYNGRPREAAALARAGANLDHPVADQTPRTLAAASGSEALRAAVEGRSVRWAEPDSATRVFFQALGLGMNTADSGVAAMMLALLPTLPSVNVTTGEGSTPLHAAAASAQPTVVQALLERGADPNVVDGAGTRPLHLAAAAGDAASTRLILRAGADPAAPLPDGMTPLHQAALGGRTVRSRSTLHVEDGHIVAREPDTPFEDVALVLLAAGADPRVPGPDGRTAVEVARSRNAPALADALERGNLTAALEWAASRHAVFASELLSMGVAPSAHALVAAVGRDDTGLVQAMLAAGARPGEAAGAGMGGARPGSMPLHVAAGRGEVAMVRLLLGAGASPDAVEPVSRQLPLHSAMNRIDAAEVADVAIALLDAGARPAVPDSARRTPLHRVAGTVHVEVARRLIAAGAPVDARSTAGETPLMRSLATGRRDMAELLLQSGARVDTRDAADRTPLHHAAAGSDTAVIALLLRLGAPVDAVDREGRTPLSLAAASWRRPNVDLLLAAGSAPLRADTAGRTPLWHAADGGRIGPAAALIARGADPFHPAGDGSTPAERATARAIDSMNRVIWCSADPETRLTRLAQLSDSLAGDATFRALLESPECSAHAVTQLVRGETLLSDARGKLSLSEPVPAHRDAAQADAALAAVLPTTDPRRIEAQRILAEALAMAGHFDGAEDALKELFRRMPDSDTARARIHALRAEVTFERGQAPLALSEMRHAVETARTTALASPSPAAMERWSWTLAEQARLHARLGDGGAAARLMDGGMERLDTEFDQPVYLAMVDAGVERFQASNPSASVRLARIAHTAGPYGADGLRRRFVLGRALLSNDELEEGREQLAAVLAQARTSLGAEHPLVADAAFELGRSLALHGDNAAALPLLDHASRTGAPVRVNFMRLYAATLQARAALETGAADGIERMVRLRATENRLPEDSEDHDGVVAAMELYVHELEMALAAKEVTADAGLDLPFLASASQRAYIDRFYPPVRDALMGLQVPGALTHGYDGLSRWKGMLVHLLGRYSAGAPDAAVDPDANNSRERLQDVRAQLSAWSRRIGEVPQHQWEARYRELTAQKELLEGSLGVGPVQGDPLGSGRVAEFLEAGETLVDIYRYQVEGSVQARYAAAIVRPDAEPMVVQLGSAGRIDAAVEDWRRTVAGSGAGTEEWAALDSLVWAPVAAALPEGVTRLWVSPDGALSKLPWQLLAGHRTGIAVAVVPAPREIVRLRTQPAVPGRTALLVGDVDFNAGALPAEQGSAFSDLPGTATELDALTALARRNRINATTTRGAGADKASVVAGMQAAAYVHIATHGFFEGGRGDVRGSRSRIVGAAAPRAQHASRNPLLESGLALAGANASPGRDRGAGVLTAEEIVGLDLSRAHLVVLSACETALGSEVDGQGVMGLQAALLASGARGLLMSLWKVPDESTALLMTTFYEGLWSRGLSPAEALSAAQEQVRRDPRFGAPVHWAAWVLAGETW